MRGYFVRQARRVVAYLPVALMAWGLGFGLFLLGFLVADLHWFPRDALEDARQAVSIAFGKIVDGNRVREASNWSDISPQDVPKHRIVAVRPVDDDADFLMTGGEGQFLEYCPQHGCAAVILKRDGSLVHAYPYRPEELTAKRTIDLPYGEILHDDAKDTAVLGLAPLANGDLIATYDFRGTHPYGGGVARIDSDGHIIWYRRDYSDHWPKVTANGEILVIKHKVGPARIRVTVASGGRGTTLLCPRGALLEVVQVLDEDGHEKDQIPVLDALMASPYRSRLLDGLDPDFAQANGCDRVHANSVVRVGAELATRLKGVEPDDLLVSLRNLSALVVIGRSDHALKHLFTGSFLYQHSAQVAPGGNILLFDNLGSSDDGGPSRLLLYDPVSGAERTIFPNRNLPEDTNTFSRVIGNIDLSEDGSRALFVLGLPGKAYEIRLADGELLTTFENLHDVHSLPKFAGAPQKVRYFTEYGIYYAPPQLSDQH